MKARTIAIGLVLALGVGLLAGSGCPNNTPENALLTKLIVGTWDIDGFFITFNKDGTYTTDFFGDGAGEYFVNGNFIVLDSGGDNAQALAFVGIRDGKLLLATNVPVIEFTRAEQDERVGAEQ